MTELIRPALYGARHPIVALTSNGRAVAEDSAAAGAGAAAAGTASGDVVDVHGPVCESTDSLGEHPLPPLRRGDLVAIRDAGAYGASIASTYNGRPRPPQVILHPDGRLETARRRGRVAALG
jgi:diaminopimelate decarboxylase